MVGTPQTAPGLLVPLPGLGKTGVQGIRTEAPATHLPCCQVPASVSLGERAARCLQGASRWLWRGKGLLWEPCTCLLPAPACCPPYPCRGAAAGHWGSILAQQIP